MPMQVPHDKERKQTVLIADDDVALATVIATTLDVEGIETVVTHDGEEALVLARSLHPALILLDVTMPGRSGIEVCATLKTDPGTAPIPVIIVTAKADEADRMVGIAAGASAYLTKPFRPTELIALVKDVLAGQPVQPRRYGSEPGLSDQPADQLLVFAQEWRDLFAREQKERLALEEANKRLAELDRLKASFLSAMTHELLTPFGSIGITMQVLQRYSDNQSSDQQEALGDLAAEIENLYRLVYGVVKFAELVNKRREPQPKYTSLSNMIPEAVQPAILMAEARDIDFDIVVPPDIAKVFADPELLQEAIFQMAHNAVKFNQPKGTARLRAFESKGWVVIEMSDTGEGLTPERISLLGQPFEQAADALRRGREGLGIGWTFVRYVAEVHGGWIQVESPGPDQGSTFSLGLPHIAGWHELDVSLETNSEEENIDQV
jgi:signal transduction histidine kinase